MINSVGGSGVAAYFKLQQSSVQTEAQPAEVSVRFDTGDVVEVSPQAARLQVPPDPVNDPGDPDEDGDYP